MRAIAQLCGGNRTPMQFASKRARNGMRRAAERVRTGSPAVGRLLEYKPSASVSYQARLSSKTSLRSAALSPGWETKRLLGTSTCLPLMSPGA